MALRFSRVTVADLAEFMSVHAAAESAHRRYRVSEAVWQDVDNPRSLTVLISGDGADIEAWLESPERAELAARLRIEGNSYSWNAAEMFPGGVYRLKT